jgi:hypothetical protein
MVVLVKLDKIGQLRMGLESWEPTYDSDFLIKTFVIIRYYRGTRKNLHMELFFHRPSFKKIPSDHDEIVTSYVGAKRVQTINRMKQALKKRPNTSPLKKDS